MSVHQHEGTSVCIHAVCVSPEHRRKGIALALLKEYIVRLERARQDGSKYERVLLITHDNMRSLYDRAGFEWLGKSDVVHGALPWYNMLRVLISTPTPPSQAPKIPPGLWESLQRPATRAPPVAQLLPSYTSGLDDVAEQSPSSSVRTNKFDLLCPRSGCGSIILKNGAATLIERESLQLEPVGSQVTLATLPDPPATLHWWRVTPNAMAFENIGFSKTILREGGMYVFHTV